MTPEQTIRAALCAMEDHDLEECFSYVNQDFVAVSDTFPRPLNKSEWLAQNANLLAAFPDWKFNIQSLIANGNEVTVTVRPSGTHSGLLLLSMRDLPPIAPTGKHISYLDKYNFIFRGNRIAVMRFDSPPDGGVYALLQQLGVQASV